MKIKVWQFEYDFDKADAEIVIPFALVVVGLAFTPLNKTAIWVGGVVYYALFFFLTRLVGLGKALRHRLIFRCPHCKSHDVFEQGYQEYHGDIPYMWHLCNHCGETSILMNDGKLIKPGPGREAKVKASRA